MSPPPAPVQFGSISPGDVESISEGEIPEADPDVESESTPACELDPETSQMSPKLAAASESVRDSEPAETTPVDEPQDSLADVPSQAENVVKDEPSNSLMRYVMF